MKNEDLKYQNEKMLTIGISKNSHVEFNKSIPKKDIENVEKAEIIKQINAKTDRFNNWREFSWINEISDEKNLIEVQNHSKSIIYIVANWCIQERIGRNKIFGIIEELETKNFQLFVLDTSSVQPKYMREWLNKYSLNADILMYRGYSEALFFKGNEFVDYITYAFDIKNKELKRIIRKWNAATNNG